MMMLLRLGATGPRRSVAAYYVSSTGRYRTRNSIIGANSIPPFLRFLSASTSDEGHIASDSEQKLEQLRKEIEALNGGNSLNVQSPKQLSRAIFGDDTTPVNKKALIKAVKELSHDTDQQRLAALVLQYKELRPRRMSPSQDYSLRQVEAKEALDKGMSEDRPNEGLDDVFCVDEMTEAEAYRKNVEHLFVGETKIHEYWKKHLLNLSRPSAQDLVKQLAKTCPMGFDKEASPTTFLHWCRKQKQKNPRCIVFARCGDFYESFGLDAILLVEHAGLNPMGGKARAGCPKYNIQSTLDRLTPEGFSVVVYEESGEEQGKNKLKKRFLSDVVSPAMPTYMFNLVLSEDSQHDQHHYCRPYVGILSLAKGYTVVEVFVDDLAVRVHQRLTIQAIACHLLANPPADPIWYLQNQQEYNKGTVPGGIPFVSRDNKEGREVKRLSPSDLPPVSQDETEWAMSFVLRHVLKVLNHNEESNPLIEKDFRLTQRQPEGVGLMTRPLHSETAKQVGLLSDKAIPSLVASVLSPTAPAASKRLAHKWLLSPPPSHIASSISYIVQHVQEETNALPSTKARPSGVLLQLLRKSQASATVFGDIRASLRTTTDLVSALGEEAASHLLQIVAFETGLPLRNTESLLIACEKAASLIENVIAARIYDGKADDDFPTGTSCEGEKPIIPLSFFQKNEGNWRHRINPDLVKDEYAKVERAAATLERAILEDFFGWERNEGLDDRTALDIFREGKESEKFLGEKKVLYDVFDNNLLTKERQKIGEGFYQPKDRNNRAMKGRHTTKRVEDALAAYVRSCEEARKRVESVLRELSKRIHDERHISAIVCALHANTIMSTVLNHATRAKQLGWSGVSVNDSVAKEDSCKLLLKDLWPYWLERHFSVQNTIDMEGMWLLTAPNMAGKSTIMRATAAAALLSACGFCAPVGRGSHIDRFDHLNVRGASSDIPAEDKSAFGAEMADVAVLLKTCGMHSLVFVDELGRGTSPGDGAGLAAAILEEMLNKGMTGVFATHLHSILDVDDIKTHERLTIKRMAFDQQGDSDEDASWTYKLEDGECRDSLALVTAKHFGVPEKVLDRAKVLKEEITTVPHLNGRNVAHTKRTNSSFIANEPIDQFVEVQGFATQLLQTKGVAIPPGTDVSPGLALESVVYILEIPQERGGPKYYVGESDDFAKRLTQHRSRYHPGLSAIVFVVDNKTEARSFEWLLINTLKKKRVPLASDTDGKRTARQLNI